MAAKKKEKMQVAEWMYNIIRGPHITEKATMGSEYGQVTFKVAPEATKPQIKAAVETLYNVKVKAVNTLIMKGKTKRFKGVKAFRSDLKKAVVTLEAGQMIDTGTGV
jgi:large subunit ribosomal protein L23